MTTPRRSFSAACGTLARRLAFGGLALGVAGCEPAPPEASVARNVLLVSIDTLRADRLGTYGHDAPTSPGLDAFAARGVVFDRAWSEASWTLPAHVTLLSGRTPATHRVERPEQRIPSDLPLLAETLARAGWRTFGTTDGVLVSGSRGFGRGFERFDDRTKGLALALHEARRFLEALDAEERSFVFVHTYDVHCPYEPAPHVAEGFRSPDARAFDARGLCGNPTLNAMDLAPEEVRYLSDLYDAEIREADDELGRFLDWLETTGRLADTLVVITSDHGEAFDEHGEIGHERSLHRELLHVPLIAVGPGLPRGARVSHPVGLVDVVPTVLAALELPPLDGAEGRSLLAPVPDLARHSRLRWQAELDSVLVGSHHLIVPADGAATLYDCRADPLEQRDLAPAQPERVAELRALVEAERARAQLAPPAPELGPADLEPAELERLRALGYVLDGS